MPCMMCLRNFEMRGSHHECNQIVQYAPRPCPAVDYSSLACNDRAARRVRGWPCGGRLDRTLFGCNRHNWSTSLAALRTLFFRAHSNPPSPRPWGSLSISAFRWPSVSFSCSSWEPLPTGIGRALPLSLAVFAMIWCVNFLLVLPVLDPHLSATTAGLGDTDVQAGVRRIIRVGAGRIHSPVSGLATAWSVGHAPRNGNVSAPRRLATDD